MSAGDLLLEQDGAKRDQPPRQPSVKELLKAIGRAGGKGLSVAHARILFGFLLDGELSGMQTGAALMALRVRGESRDEVLGALDALRGHLRPLALDGVGPVVLIPSYNGARQLPNLVPLLACLLADEGIAVVVHGMRKEASRVTTAEIFRAMGIDPVEHEPSSLGHVVKQRLARGDPAFLPVDVLSPALAGLLACRDIMGVRNTGHTLAKLVQPVLGAEVLQLACFTHSAFQTLQQEVFVARGDTALQSRGCEGEVVAHPRRLSAQVLIREGRTSLMQDDETLEPAGTPVLPAAQDIAATAAWIQSVLAGAVPVPRAIAEQVSCIRNALQAGEGGRLRPS